MEALVCHLDRWFRTLRARRAVGARRPADGLVDCVMIFRKSRGCLHDEIADTIVVRA